MSQSTRPPESFAQIGTRIGAYFLDSIFAAVAIVGGFFVAFVIALLVGQMVPVLGILIAILGYLFAGLGYGIYVWYLTAKRGYSPGKKVLGLRLVDAGSGEPLGFWRVWLRGFVLGLMTSLSLGVLAIVIAVKADRHPRKQGWHDLAVGSVVVPEAALIPPPPSPVPEEGVLPVRLPHMASAELDRMPQPAMPDPVEIAEIAEPVKAATPTQLLAPLAAPPPVPPVPGPPGMVAGPPPIGASEEAPPAAEPAIDESTRLALRRQEPARSWSLAPDLGTAFDVTVSTLIGRDPDGSLGGAETWSIDDPERTVSKTHALVGVDGDDLWIEDWDSTNGVSLRRDGIETELASRVRTTLREGDAVLLGDFVVNVRRGV